MIRPRKILMTGCSTGFGVTIRKRLLEQGHAVVGAGLNGPDIEVDLSTDNWIGDEIFEQASKQRCHQLRLLPADVAKWMPDTLILNAGITQIEWIENVSSEIEQARKVLQVNLLANIELCSAFVRQYHDYYGYSQDTVGKIIMTGSMGGNIGLRACGAYVASKEGLHGFARSLAKELAGRRNIAVYVVAPGGVGDTKMHEQVVEGLVKQRGMTEEEAEAYSRQSPFGRNSTHEELWPIYDMCVNQLTEYWSGSIFRQASGLGVFV